MAVRALPAALLIIVWFLSSPFVCAAAPVLPTIKVGSEIDFPPFADVDERGRPIGFSVDLIKAVAEVMGLKLDITTGTWDSMWSGLIAGRIDLLPIVTKLPERMTLIDFTLSHTETFDAFFVRASSPVIKDIASAGGKSIVVMKSDAAHHALLERKFKGELILVDTISQGLSLIASGRHDAFLCSKLIGSLVIQKKGITGLIAGPPIPEYKRDFAFGIRKGNNELREMLNQGLRIVRANGEYARIYEKWLHIEVPAPKPPRANILKTIIIDSFYPFTFMNKQGQPDGFVVDLIREVTKNMGMEIDIRPGGWNYSMKALEKGDINLLPLMAYSRERDKIFDFSSPYTTVHDAIFIKRGGTRFQTLEELRGKKVIVMNHDAAHEFLMENNITTRDNLIVADSLPETLRLLALGKGDAALMPKLIGLLHIRNLGLTNIDPEPAVISDYHRPFSIAVKSGNRELLNTLSEGLAIVKATGEFDRIYKKWFGAVEPSGTPFKEVMRDLLIVVGVLLLVLIVSVIWALTLKKQVAQRTKVLEESEARFRSYSELPIAGFAITSRAAEWVMVNDCLCAMLGYSRKELLQKKWFELTHPDDLNLDRELFKRVLAGEQQGYSLDKRFIRKNGATIWTRLSSQCVRLPDGTVNYFVKLLFDITERKQVEEEREQLFRQLQDKAVEMERFTYTVSHDLKSPLITISGFLGILRSNFVAGDETQFTTNLERISRATERMKQLLDELLELSRIGRKVNPSERVKLGDVIQTALDDISGRIRQCGAAVEVEADLPEVTADRRRLLQVFDNLIDNAVKFSCGMPQPPRIKIGVRRDNGAPVIFVRDNGIGLEPRHQNKVFDLFEKLDPHSGGTGVGLAIVKRIIEVHGGGVWVESEGLGTGATFCFTLPGMK